MRKKTKKQIEQRDLKNKREERSESDLEERR